MSSSENFIKMDFSNRGCLPNLAKYYLFVINFLLSALGGFACGYGAVSLVAHSATSTGSTSIIPHILAIVSGVLLILLANLALQGTYKENIVMLKVYAWILVVFVILRIIIIILDAVRSKQEFPNPAYFEKQFDLYGTDKTATEEVDTIQKSLFCCGFNGPESMKFGNGSYPLSCCVTQTGLCYTPYILKCSTEIEKAFFPTSTMFYIVGFYIIFAIEILTAVATFYFISFLKKQSRLKLMTRYNNL